MGSIPIGAETRCGLMERFVKNNASRGLSAFFLFRVHDARARDLPSLWWLVLAYMKRTRRRALIHSKVLTTARIPKF